MCLTQAVAQSAYFLPQYDLRKADSAVKALRQRLVDAGPAAAPQRRAFGFSKAVKRTSALQTADGAPDAESATPASTDEQQHHSSSVARGGATIRAEHGSQNGACPAANDGSQLHDAPAGRCGYYAAARLRAQRLTGRNSLTASAIVVSQVCARLGWAASRAARREPRRRRLRAGGPDRLLGLAARPAVGAAGGAPDALQGLRRSHLRRDVYSR